MPYINIPPEVYNLVTMVMKRKDTSWQSVLINGLTDNDIGFVLDNFDYNDSQENIERVRAGLHSVMYDLAFPPPPEYPE